jgi:hypothetical protein
MVIVSRYETRWDNHSQCLLLRGLKFYQPVLSLGAENVGRALEALANIGEPSEDDWRTAFSEAGIDIGKYVTSSSKNRAIDPADVSHIENIVF